MGTNATTQSTSSATNTKVEGRDEISKDEFEIVKEYLLKCPHVSSVRDSPAIKAAIEGIEKEQRRQIRDAKLRSKFVAGVKANSSSIDSFCLADGEEIVVVEKHDIDVTVVAGNPDATASTTASGSNNINDDDMEWQDVQKMQKEEIIDVGDDMASSGIAIGDSFSIEQGEESDGNNSCCYLGRTLAKACIDAIGKQQNRTPVVVSTPLAAIAVALHSGLRSDVLGFACTGVPEDKTKGGGSNGFAPPVRELSIDEFLPRGWDNDGKGGKHQSPLPLRYRKMDTGAVVLKIEGLSAGGDEKSATEWAGIECQVTFVPSNGKGDSTQSGLKFPLSDHINLDSWNTAMHKTVSNSKIAPSLHYKNLAGLLSKFCQTFDLGSVNSHTAADGCETDPDMTHATKISSSDHAKMETPTVFAQSDPVGTKLSKGTTESRQERSTAPSTLDEAFPAAAAVRRRDYNPNPLMDYPPRGGDFPDDLLPASSGLQDPRFGRAGGRMSGSGNLMGPNHPIFSQGGGHDSMLPVGGPGGGFAFGGPGTMQPRYDPIVPPGIGGSDNIPQPAPSRLPNSNKNNRRSRIPGEPNPDHLPPPNSLGDNMFM